MFCKKCGGLLVPKKVKGKKTFVCSSCKAVEKDTSELALVEKVEEKDEVQVVDESQDMQTLPEIEEECPECGNTKARYWVVQTRASDEAPTKFIKCEKCGHTWRDYS
ncbi:MAG: transcription factor S [Nanoarchaeota archaeon]